MRLPLALCQGLAADAATAPPEKVPPEVEVDRARAVQVAGHLAVDRAVEEVHGRAAPAPVCRLGLK